MHPVDRFESILLLLVVVIGLELAARRFRLPPAAALVAGGMGLAFVPGVPVIALDPDLALVPFLPPPPRAARSFRSCTAPGRSTTRCCAPSSAASTCRR